MKVKNCIYIMVGMVVLAACTSDDITNNPTLSEEQIEQSLSSKIITFSASGAEEQISRASDGYRDWNATYGPTTMGVFGWHDLNALSNGTSPNKMFYNTENRYNYTDNPHISAWSDAKQGKWTYQSPKYWADYTYWSSFDFFACMPYRVNTTVLPTSNANEYKMTIPAISLGAVKDVYFTKTDTTFVCHTPKHLSAPGYEGNATTIPMQFDQTLAGMRLEFKLGENMSKLRQFRIKNVQIDKNEEGLPTAGDITRTYTWNPGTSKWSANQVTWVNLTKNAADLAESLVEIPGAQTDAVVTYSQPKKWGDRFFVIPSMQDFTPTLIVTYDVEVAGTETYYADVAEYNTAKSTSLTESEFAELTPEQKTKTPGTVTRKNVVSKIKLCADKFDNYDDSHIKPGYVTTVQIYIVPDYLYVLADDDQVFGLLITNSD